MTTLIAVYNSEGYIGRCDAKCYNATGDHCECVCGGANHGAGLNQAITNTEQMVDEWIEDIRERHGNKEDPPAIEVTPNVQLALFEVEP